MSDSPPDYVAARIRQSVPNGVRVVHGSTPVVSFGDVSRATVATLGLNPSRREFLGEDGAELTGSDRRLESLASIGESELTTASDEAVRRIFEGCNSYFGRQPYRRWFDKLERILKPLGASYYDRADRGSACQACHLDLVQWATDPTWSKLPPAKREQLLEFDVPFLRRQLFEGNIKLLLMNGGGVVGKFQSRLGIDLVESQIPGTRIRLLDGKDARGLRIIGWNINLQGNWGVKNLEIDMIAERIRELVELEC